MEKNGPVSEVVTINVRCGKMRLKTVFNWIFCVCGSFRIIEV